MTVSLFRRMTASFIDLAIILVIVYGLFFVGGRTILRNQIDDYYVLNDDYTEIVEAYNTDISRLSAEYDVAVELADGNEEQIEIAAAEYDLKKAIVNDQNTIDINPYNDPLTSYFSSVINFFIVGFFVLITIVTLVTVGKTPGRRLVKVKLMTQISSEEYENPTLLPVFLHDIFLKYFFIVGLFVFNMFYGIVFMLIAFMMDIILITFTKSHSTIRDYFTKQRVVKDGYGF